MNLVEEHERDQAELNRILEMRGAKPINNVVDNLKAGVVQFINNI